MKPYRVRRQPDRPVDWSMDLLKQIEATALEPEYGAVAARGESPKSRGRWVLAVVCLVVGFVVAVQAHTTVRAAPAVEVERQELIARVKDVEKGNEDRRTEQKNLERQISDLQGQLTDQATQQRLETLATVAGQQAVSGPGIVVVVDDADPGNGAGSRVTDVDLRQLANGLWAAGAEAISINGHRLSARTAIRGAGAAITVDYRSLLRPYKVEAIGDPRTLPARFADTGGGAWWADAKANYGLKYDVSTSGDLRLEADPGLTVTSAKKAP